MNKSELINAIAEKALLSRNDARNALEATLDAIVDAVNNDDAVTIVGFGSFIPNIKPERTGINPRTKELITIAAHRMIRFKPGAGFNKHVD